MEFTDEQIEHWRAYERVRADGSFSMLTSAAKEASGLTDDQYRFVWENYSALKSAARRQEQSE